jgi:LPS O-antigen subunit length determinant protein (WzzB/FepE family)
MAKNSKINNDEINLIELIFTLWESKWKIAVAVIISLIAVISYDATKTKNFTAITEIKPIDTFEINKFFAINNLFHDTNNIKNNNTNTNTNNIITNNIKTNKRFNIAVKINEITSLKLLNLYLNILKKKSVFEDAIRKFNLLEASQYNNEQDYNEAIIRLASSIKILSPKPNSFNSKNENLENSYHTISFTYYDAEKWKSALTYVDETVNELVKKNLIDEYNNTLLFLENERKYQLEDISMKINNYIIDYDREIYDKVEYLKEQSEIAKKLGIEKNTIEVETFGNQNALLSNVKTDSPFYLRGYKAIDKEIELIQLRTNKNAFIEGLFEMEKKKRSIEQDQTIERVKLALQSNLLTYNNNKFSVASIKTITTKLEYKDYKSMYALAIFIGLIAGIFYVQISNGFQSLRVSKKTN